MLAAASAWRIFEAEHRRLRQFLAEIASVLESDGWRQNPGQQVEQLVQLIHDFQDFEANEHRPKGVVLLGSLRGRSAEADQLLDVLDDESQLCDERLARALELLDKAQRDGKVAGGEVASLLQQHRDLMTQHLDREDTVLRSYTAQLLTPEEWSAVVSSISSVVRDTKRRRAQRSDQGLAG